MPRAASQGVQMGVKRVKRHIALVEVCGARPWVEPGDGRGFEIGKRVILSDMQDDDCTAVSKCYGTVAVESMGNEELDLSLQPGFGKLVSVLTSLVTKKVTAEFEERGDARVRLGEGHDLLNGVMRSSYTHVLVRRMFEKWCNEKTAKVILKAASKTLGRLYRENGYVQGSKDFILETKDQLRRYNRGREGKHVKATVAPKARLELVKQAAEQAFGNSLQGGGFVDIIDVYLKANMAVYSVVSLEELDALEASAHLVTKTESLPWVSYFVCALRQHHL